MVKEVVDDLVMLREEKKSIDLSIKIIKKYRFVGGDMIIDEDSSLSFLYCLSVDYDLQSLFV